jgi:hypothetical protein
MCGRFCFHQDHHQSGQKYKNYCARINTAAVKVMQHNVIFSSTSESRTYSLLHFMVLMNNMGSGQYMLVKKQRPRQSQNASPSNSSDALLPKYEDDKSSLVELSQKCFDVRSIISGRKQMSLASSMFLYDMKVCLIVLCNHNI